jgi:GxxExxY protein
MHENEISGIISDAAIEVHKTLGGPGLIEDLYEEALAWELKLRGLDVRRQLGFRVVYKGRELDKRLVLDLIVNERVIVEVKATEKEHPIFKAQLLTYLRATDKRLGLLVNFGGEKVSDGFSRVVNHLVPPQEL